MRRSWWVRVLSVAIALSTVGIVPGRWAAAQPTARAVPPAGGAVRVGVVPMRIQGTIPAAIQQAFERRLAEGLAGARFEVVADAGPRRPLRPITCETPSCFAEAAQRLGVRYVVAGSVVESGKTYTVDLALHNGADGTVAASARDRCELCGFVEAGEKIELAASTLRRRLEASTQAPARFLIRTSPAGATVLMDGQPVGASPADVQLSPGTHQLTVNLRGHEPLQRTVTAVAGVEEQLSLELVSTPGRWPWRTLGWVGLAAGAAVMGAGVWAVAVDDREVACSDGERDLNGRCPHLRDTGTMGAVLTAVGAAGMTAGATLLVVGGPPGRETSVTVAVRGRF